MESKTFVGKSAYSSSLEANEVSRYMLVNRLRPIEYGMSTGCRAVASTHHGSAVLCQCLVAILEVPVTSDIPSVQNGVVVILNQKHDCARAMVCL